MHLAVQEFRYPKKKPNLLSNLVCLCSEKKICHADYKPIDHKEKKLNSLHAIGQKILLSVSSGSPASKLNMKLINTNVMILALRSVHQNIRLITQKKYFSSHRIWQMNEFHFRNFKRKKPLCIKTRKKVFVT